MTRIVEVPVEPLTHNGFAPFGQIVGVLEGEPAWKRPRLTSWRMKFSMAGHPDLKMLRYHFQDMEFDMMENHITHTETRIPLSGGQFVMAVAAPTEPMDQSVKPNVEDIHAFLIDGTEGIMFWRGTWHALDTYPVRPPYTDVAFISEIETQREIEVEGADPASAKLTKIANFREDDVRFKVIDPHGLLGPK